MQAGIRFVARPWTTCQDLASTWVPKVHKNQSKNEFKYGTSAGEDSCLKIAPKIRSYFILQKQWSQF